MAAKSTELILMARAARRYYVDDMSKTDIADELGVSRFRVARLIDTAKRTGMVQIQIAPPAGIDTELSVDAAAALRPRARRRASTWPTTIRRPCGCASARWPRKSCRTSSAATTCSAWPGPVRCAGSARRSRGSRPAPSSRLTGALSGPDGSDMIELVRRVAAVRRRYAARVLRATGRSGRRGRAGRAAAPRRLARDGARAAGHRGRGRHRRVARRAVHDLRRGRAGRARAVPRAGHHRRDVRRADRRRRSRRSADR